MISRSRNNRPNSRTMEEMDPKKLIMAKMAAQIRSSFTLFCQWMCPSYEMNWHHNAMMWEMQQLADKKVQRLMMNVPPRHGKSTYSVLFAAYYLGHNPNHRVALIAYSQRVASRFSVELQDLMMSENYKLVFPNIVLPHHQSRHKRKEDYFQLLDAQKNAYKGYFLSSTIDGSVRSYGVELMILDDLIKNYEESRSLTFLDKLWDFYNGVSASRLEGPKLQIINSTRYSEDDLCGKLIQKQPEAWRQVVFQTEKTMQHNHFMDPREEGEILWPEQLNRKEADEKKVLDSMVWNTEYMSNPIPAEGNMVKRQYLEDHVITKYDYNIMRMRRPEMQFFIDPAYTEKKHNDPTAIVAVSSHGNNLFVHNAVEVRKEFVELVEFIVDWVKDNGYTSRSTIFVEPKASGLSLISHFAQTPFNVTKLRDRRIPFAGKKVSTYRMSKVERLQTVLPKMEAGKVKFIEGAYMRSLFDQLCAFPNSTHDDLTDALTFAMLDTFHGQKGKGRILNPWRNGDNNGKYQTLYP
jgi:phage terminase large subunit-like protein